MKRPVVIIDYLDKISPGIEPVYKNTYERSKQTYEKLNEIAKKNNVAILLKIQPTTTAELDEIRKEQLAQQKLKADNEAFDHFIATGEVKEIPPNSYTPGGEAIKYEPTLKIFLNKKRPHHG